MGKPNPFPKNIAALVMDLAASTEGYPEGCNAHITPDGRFRADDGRPRSMEGVEVDDWLMNAEIAAKLIARLESSGKPILYDYEHNSMWGDTRAAGWIVKLVYVAGRGLFGRVEWTPTGAKEIADKDYRYSSPLFFFDPKTGAVTALLSVALTNNPALGDLGAVDLVRRAALAALPVGALAAQFSLTTGGLPGNPPGDVTMTPEQLAALTAERDSLKSNVAALTAERDGLKTQLADLSKQLADFNAAQAAAALAAETDEKTKLIAAATSGDKPKMTPAQAEHLKAMPLAELKAFVETLGAVPLTAKQSEKPGGEHGLTDAQLALCSSMGVTPEQFIAAQKQQA